MSPPRSFLVLVAALLPGSASAAENLPAEPLYTRHVVPLLSRLGCNSGACHGTVQGQNGFKLTLFGADPVLDHERLLREYGGRRLNLAEPEASLFLQKAAGQVPHQGGARLRAGSPEYQLLRDWIARGAALDAPAKSQLRKLEVSPATQTLQVGEKAALQVTATFADGTQEDVTRLATVESSDKEVLAVDETGRVEARVPGDGALIVRFRAEPIVATVVVPRPGGAPVAGAPGNSFIDRHVREKLRRLSLSPSSLCDEATFLRRASLDVTGELPTPEEIRKFLADPAADKRAKKIDELLARPGHATVWATKFCDLLKPTGFNANFGFQEPADARRFHDWLRARLQENLPYDQLAERILTATSREGRPAEAWVEEVKTMAEEDASGSHELKAYAGRRTLDLYWQRGGATGVKGAIQVAHAFLGLRLECAQCHRHPHDVWQQDDLLSFANFFTRLSNAGYNGSASETAKTADAMVKEAKALREQAKKIGEQAKDKKLPKEELDKLTAEANDLNRKARALEEGGKRIKGTEIHINVKAASASMSSPLGTQKSDKLRLLGESQPVTVAADQDARQLVADWLRRPDNRFFSRAIVNRIWAHYFGRGIIDPADQLSPLNPPSHPELLNELAEGLVKNGFDLKWVHRAILNSQTYQTSSQTTADNQGDTRNYATFYRRRLSAELLVDAINHATGGSETFPNEVRLPPGARAIELAGEMKADGRDAKASALAYALLVFGRPQRNPEVQCDCERDTAPTMVQMLYLANHPAVREKIAAADGRVAKLIKEVADEGRRVEEVFLWSLSRLPTNAEKTKCLAYLKEASSPERGLQGVLWSLLNTREFLLIH
ncbi:MAG: DUF1553 domain-containing protein [Planctomycetia bacterium]|nr:DUF1553 domain-containing protein [Planctomycetia bacterium]